jgi:hypothetical protein
MSPPEDDSEPPHITEDGIFDLGGRSAHDGPLEAAMLGAAMRLPSGQPDAARQIQEVAYKRCDHRIHAQIDGLLAAKGYQLIDRSREVTLEGIETFIARSRQEKTWLLERLSELGPQRPLKAVERRRLNNLGRVIHALAYMKLEAGAIGNAIRRDPVDLTRMINFVVDCSGLDRSTVASEAIARLQEPEDDVALLCELPPCRLTYWDAIDIPETITWLGSLFQNSYLLARQSQLALAQVPGEHRPRALDLARTAAENGAMPTRNRFLAAQLACYFNRDAMIERWRDAADPMLRSSVMSVLREHPERQSILFDGIRHTDNLVRTAAVEALTDADLTSENLLEALRCALATEQPSTCRYCGLGGQTGEERNCSRCERSLPNPQHSIRQKLNAAAKLEA